jgi:signal transduction histidine kinase
MQDDTVTWRARLLDAAVVLLTVAFSVVPYEGVESVILGVVAVSLAFRRHTPTVVAWVVAASAAGLTVAELVGANTLLPPDVAEPLVWWPPAAPVAAYSAMVFAGNRPRAWLAAGALVVVALGAPASAGIPFEVTSRSLVTVGAAAVLGMYVAARRRLLLALTERAERAEREQRLLAEQARADERVRLAAEIHDVVTHRVSLMVLQAGALRMTAADEATRDAAEGLRATGCQALDELRDLVGILRDRQSGADDHPSGETVDQALGPALSALISESESVGVPVELVEHGDPALVSPVVARTAYRILQEALTNVRKHAPGAKVEALVSYRGDSLQLTVVNTAATRTADASLTAAGSRTGLTGLRQRVELIDGALHAGRDDAGGFRLEATLPTYVTSNRPPS